MRIITCASYCSTGSSAVTDLFSEFDNCSFVGDYEFRFIHDPDGVRDLEYNLIDNNNRHNTSNAIKRFLRYTKFLGANPTRKVYRRYMGDDFYKYTLEYVDKITELQTEAWWHYDRMERGSVFDYIDSAITKLGHYIFRTNFITLLKPLHEKAYYSAIDRETFYKYTREYTENVIGIMNKNHTDFIMVDQLVPPSNLDRYLNYFNDVRVVVVERDPRDLFLVEHMEWKSGVVPAKSVEEFCKWYEITRRHRKTEIYNSDKVYFLQFEDLIYKYEATVEKLIQFVGIPPQNHVAPGTHLNPAVSVKNTNLKKNYPQCKEDIQYIEERLGEYLYEFPQ